MLNKQSRTADKWWSPSLGVGRGANNPSTKKLALFRNGFKCFGPEFNLSYNVSNGKGK
jgi:hypothetical protein